MPAVVRAAGGIAPDTHEKAEAAGEADEASVNHPAGGAPAIEPTRRAGGGAMLAGVGARLGGEWTKARGREAETAAGGGTTRFVSGVARAAGGRQPRRRSSPAGEGAGSSGRKVTTR